MGDSSPQVDLAAMSFDELRAHMAAVAGELLARVAAALAPFLAHAEPVPPADEPVHPRDLRPGTRLRDSDDGEHVVLVRRSPGGGAWLVASEPVPGRHYSGTTKVFDESFVGASAHGHWEVVS